LLLELAHEKCSLVNALLPPSRQPAWGNGLYSARFHHTNHRRNDFLRVRDCRLELMCGNWWTSWWTEEKLQSDVVELDGPAPNLMFSKKLH
jgi:hypothetical protein